MKRRMFPIHHYLPYKMKSKVSILRQALDKGRKQNQKKNSTPIIYGHKNYGQ